MILSLQHVSKIYTMGEEEVRALDDVNLHIDEGEFVAIVGPSGSGKSTLMNIMGFLDTPTTGDFIFLGKNAARMNDNELAEIRNKHIGFIFQQFNLLPKLTAAENVEVPLLYGRHKISNRRQKVIEALTAVGLGQRINHKPTELSGGQQQRVAIARALIADPTIILADEPTGNLDSKSGKEILEILQELNRRGKTIILITHDLSIASCARRRVLVQDGRIIEDKKVLG